MSGRSGGRGRGGEYYKSKYGRGGRGRDDGGRGRDGGGRGRGWSSASSGVGGTYDDLRRLLQSIEGRPYPSYHDIETTIQNGSGGWVLMNGTSVVFTLEIGRAQADPFAAPTRCRVTVPSTVAALPSTLWSNPIRRIALADYLWRLLYQKCRHMGADQSLRPGGADGSGDANHSGWNGPKGGDIQIMEPTQHVVEQTAVSVDVTGNVTGQLTVNLPARGRTILGTVATTILEATLVQLVTECLMASSMDLIQARHHVESVEDQAWLQSQLARAGLVAFVPNGAILPRRSGIDDRPMPAHQAIAFVSPPSLQVSFALPNAGTAVTGLGIRRGITLICGGGFHGKSTLLEALQLAVYYKIPGDGREFCVASAQSVKIRAEDGRSVTAVDISSFIQNLPLGKDTTCFSTADASGSTSQAANIVESIEMGADTLLIDEDTCATNFMIRDHKMVQLVASEKEPIMPFVQVVESLKEQGISTILVVGGTGDFFDVADHVLVLDSYCCEDATLRARQIVQRNPSASHSFPFHPIKERFPIPDRFNANGKVKVSTKSSVLYGTSELDLQAVEQIISKGQTTAIVNALQLLSSSKLSMCLRESLACIERTIDSNGLDALAPGQMNGAQMRPRLLEISAAANRLRQDCLKQT